LIQDFVCDQLSNWYVRLNRKRFWGGEMDSQKAAAYQTLFACLKTVALLGAPLAPVYMERLFMDLTGNDSVHLELMPTADETLIDTALEERMDMAQRCTSLVLALRRKVNIKVRQPLSKILIPVLDPSLAGKLEQVRPIILSEVNVKDMEFIHDTAGLIHKGIKPNFKVLGKKYGPQMKEITAALNDYSQQEINDLEKATENGAYELVLASGPVSLERNDVTITSQDMPGWLIAADGPLTVALDVTITDELRREGIARELVNRIQNLRKDTGLDVTDKIRVILEDRSDVAEALQDFSQYIAQQVLATQITLSAIPPAAHAVEWEEGTLNIHIDKS